MADEKPKRRRREPDEEQATNGTRERVRRRVRGRRLSGAELAQQARQELEEITGLGAESVTALERNEDDSWTVTVELLELSRIPETEDMLGSYEVDLDEDGELLGYRRVRRYPRSLATQEPQVHGG
jgi:Zn-dependent oligopeptidase